MSSHATAEPDFGLLFALAFRCYVDHLHEELATAGFTGVRAAFGPVLRALRAGDSTLVGLARDLGVTKQAVARVLDDMRADGLVEQRADPADGRVRLLSLTERGRTMVGTAIAIGTRFESALAEELDDARVRELRAGLEHIVERAGAAGELAARRVRSI
jgi:DNA-binding MarR family transcriptional regulator